METSNRSELLRDGLRAVEMRLDKPFDELRWRSIEIKIHPDAVKVLSSGKAWAIEQATDYLTRRNFRRYFGLFGSHVRLHALLAVEMHLTDQEYWPLVGDVWRVEEIFFPNKATWLRLLSSPRAGREAIMTKRDRRTLAVLPDEFEIFRGYTGRGANGFSWTLSAATADQFVKIAGGPRRQWLGANKAPGRVVSGKCRKADVFAYFGERNEQEIVIDPRKVNSRRSVRVA